MKKFLVLFILLSSCNEPNGRDLSNKEVSDWYDKVCIENHIYYEISSGHRASMAIKLDDDGKPVKCDE